jgi:hypothetical protein
MRRLVEDTVLFSMDLTFPKALSTTLISLYQEFLNSQIDPAFNVFASLRVSDAFRDIYEVSAARFYTVRRSCEHPTVVHAKERSQALAERFGVIPSSAEWRFAHWERSSFTTLEASDDEDSTDDSTDGPVTVDAGTLQYI